MRQQRGEWQISNSKKTGATTNAVDYTRGAKAAVFSAERMVERFVGEATVTYKGQPAGRLVGGRWVDITNPTLKRAVVE